MVCGVCALRDFDILPIIIVVQDVITMECTESLEAVFLMTTLTVNDGMEYNLYTAIHKNLVIYVLHN